MAVVEHRVTSSHVFAGPLDNFSLPLPLLHILVAKDGLPTVEAGRHEDIVGGSIVHDILVGIVVVRKVLLSETVVYMLAFIDRWILWFFILLHWNWVCYSFSRYILLSWRGVWLSLSRQIFLHWGKYWRRFSRFVFRGITCLRRMDRHVFSLIIFRF